MSDALYIDTAKLYFGNDVRISENVSIHSPTIGDVIEYGEKEYYSMISALTSIPSDMKSSLWDMGVDYEAITDMEFFFMMTRNLTPNETGIILGDLDLSKLKMYQNIENDTLVLGYSEEEIMLNELTYARLARAVRMIHGIKPKVEKAANKTTKKILIQLDREKTEKAKKRYYQRYDRRETDDTDLKLFHPPFIWFIIQAVLQSGGYGHRREMH